MARLWKYAMICFLMIGLIMRRENEMMDAMMNTPFVVLDLLTTLILSACLWGGFLNIIEKTGFMNYFSMIFYPVLRLIYGQVVEHKEVYACLSSNLIANLLGLGSLASMSGLKAFRYLNQYCLHDYASRQMLTLVIMNTAGFCLFPSTLVMMRMQFQSSDVYAFYPYMIVISLSIMIVGLCIQRMIDHE